MPSFTRSELRTRLATAISGNVSSSDLNIILNRAVIEVLSSVDVRSMKRRTPLTPNLFDDVFQYTAPTDLKGHKIVDIQPQINRGRFDDWQLTTCEEFDRLKQDRRDDRFGDPINFSRRNAWLGQALVAVSDYDFVRKILLSRPIDDQKIVIDSLDSVGDWTAVGDAENVEVDTGNFVKGSGSISFDIDASGTTTAGIENASITSTDISAFISEGSLFVWVYIVDKDDITNFIARLGSTSAVYNTITITTVNEGTAFADGWNLLRFDMANKTLVGTPDNEAITFATVFMTKATGKVSEVNYRFDNLVLRLGDHYNLHYYSKYGWQSSAGTYLEESTSDTDLVNVDTDELKLIEYKATELAETHLGNDDRSSRNFQLYENKVKEYEANVFSTALPLSTAYYNSNQGNNDYGNDYSF